MWRKLRYRKDDPLRYLHVPRKDRLSDDGGPASDASTDQEDFDRDEVRQNTEVVAEEDLQ